MFGSWFTWLTILLIVSIAFVIIIDDGDSQSKLIWLLIVSVFPIIGLIFYLLLGINQRNNWYFRKNHQRYFEFLQKNMTPELRDFLFNNNHRNNIPEKFRPLLNIGQSDMQSPTVCDADDVQIITSGQQKYQLLMQDLANAKHSIHLEYFRFGKDESSRAVLDMLIKKAHEGVEVRFIYENIVNPPIPPKYFRRLRKEGIEVIDFTNTRFDLLRFICSLNYRDHRKIVVIDGKIGYTGGMNINDNYFHKWRDTHLRITGNAVATLQYIFFDSWFMAEGELDKPFINYFPMVAQPARTGKHTAQLIADAPEMKWPIIQMTQEWLLQNAKQYMYFQTPYLAPPTAFLHAIQTAALSGIDVRIMVPKKNDTPLMRLINRSHYSSLLQAGVKIYERSGEFIHSKTYIVDDEVCSVGSANMDNRSLTMCYELNTQFFDKQLALQSKQIFFEDLKQCRQVDIEAWKKYAKWRKVQYGFARILAPLM